MVHCNATLWYRTSNPYIYNLTIDLLLLLELYLSLFHSTVESFDVSLYILLAEARILQQQPCKALFWNGWQSSGILGEVSTVKESHDFWERGEEREAVFLRSCQVCVPFGNEFSQNSFDDP